MIHPLQYELESARHADGQRQAARARMVAESERLMSPEMAVAPSLRSIVASFNWGAIRPMFRTGGTA